MKGTVVLHVWATEAPAVALAAEAKGGGGGGRALRGKWSA